VKKKQKKNKKKTKTKKKRNIYFVNQQKILFWFDLQNNTGN
jgi:hypothetical protein